MMQVKFTIECEMEDRWVDDFMSVLKRMEYLGNVGSSRKVALYADGDGDFRPKFSANIQYKPKLPIEDNNGNYLYDAG